ncbi:cytochrome P450 [Lentinula edodes]|uniref:Cytochrome P450 n=1 Tax=Lentinula lateritia TaxID=40482 RepID=A0A9W8ZT62_9AGAR|nr:cytochrome P450 [Lentinula edodes]
MSGFLSYLHTHVDGLNFYCPSLLRGIAVAILSASIWTLFRGRRKLDGVSSLSQLRGPQSRSWFKGNQMQIFSLKQGWEFHKMLADEYGPTVQITGLLGKKQLYTFDSKAMHHILDGSSFQPHRIESGVLLFGKGLLSTIGEHHRKQRKMLNPVFSIAHMRSMMPIFYDVVDQLQNALSQRVRNGPREARWMARTALELIGQSGFGYSFDNMVDDVPRHKYSIVIKDLVPTLTRLAFGRFYLLPLAVKILPSSVRTFIMNITPWKTLHDVRDMVNYMHDLSVEIYKEKRRALEEGDEAVVKQIGKGKDLLSIMMKENMKADDEDKLEETEIIAQVGVCSLTIPFILAQFNFQYAQMSTFILAAMDTTSSGMSRILHLLALHPKVQDKIREEIIAARKDREGSRLSYDELVGLPYLDAVCRETLRLYAPVSSVLRKSTEDTIVPLSRPVRGVDGNEVTDIFLPRATTVIISILNANRDPELWGPDVLEWKPERWLSPLPDAIMNSKMPGVYSHLMTFNGGSRSCIGFKFSQLEMKVVIAMLVENFQFSPPPDKEIFWQMASIASPVVVGGSDSMHPQLPLIVEAVKGDF